MFLIFLLVLISKVYTGSLLRTHCYESFSNPIIYLQLSYYFPIGPLFFNSTFRYSRYSYIRGIEPKIFELNYNFKRTNGTCIPSALFTTMGKDIKELILNIVIYLYQKNSLLTDFFYIFQRGFKPGVHKMFDRRQIFILHIQILDAIDNFLIFPVAFPKDAINYLSSVSGKQSELCLISDDYNAVILKPIYESNKPQGYVTIIRFVLFKNEEKITEHKYPAFECDKDEEYKVNPTVFVTDVVEFTSNIWVVDWKKKKRRIKSNYIAFCYAYNLKNIPRQFKKFFLINYKNDITKCPDRSEPILYRSRYYNITYAAVIINNIHISSLIKFVGFFHLSPSDPCGLKNKSD